MPRLNQSLCCAALILPFLLGSCGKQASSPPATRTASGSTARAVPSPPAAPVDRDSANSRLLAAAEPFENLTEQAGSASGKQLDRLISEVRRSAESVSPALPPQAHRALSQRLAAIQTARSARHPIEIALNAVEGYRILVSNTAGTLKTPQQVSLLDYAGFRVQADLKDSPPRWQDAREAVAFGRQQWSAIESQVSDRSLRDSFAAALREMGAAVDQRNPAQARSSTARELDLVDKLETFYARRS